MSKSKNELPEFITVEMSERNHCIAKKVIGTRDRFSSVATTRSRQHAENLVKLLNEQKEGKK